MTKKLIYLEDAIDALCNDYCGGHQDCKYYPKCENLKSIQKLPSAQTERKKGKWINVNDGKWNTFEVLKCSVCGELDNRMDWTDNYCPNCGADMRGENE